MNALSTLAGLVIAFVAIWSVSDRIGGAPERDAARAVMAPRAAAQDGLDVSGRVVNTLGEPVIGAVVVATTGAALEPTPRAVTDAEGRFVIRDLAPGSYSFVALHGGYPPNSGVQIALREGEDVFIVLDPDDRILA